METTLAQLQLCVFMFKVEVMKMAYQQGETEFEDEEQENGEDHAASPRNVGHNIYILAHQVHTHTHSCTYEQK